MQQEQALQMASSNPQESKFIALTSTWKNELGSTMSFTRSGQQIIGTYRSAVGSSGSIEGELVGWINGNVISFVVTWPVGSITAWTGHFTFEPQVAIEALWQMGLELGSTRNPDGTESTVELWDSIFAGRDRFVEVIEP